MFKWFILTLAILLTVICLSSYGQLTSNTSQESKELRFDTTKTAVLKLKSNHAWLFDSTYRPTRITQNELSMVDRLLINAVNNFNNRQLKNNAHHPWKIDLKSHDYRRQIITVSNKKGEKVVWVNCFCNSAENWKSEIYVVEDGGTCHFNLKINLSTKTYYDFSVNSAG